jgi:hypothetical protein
MIATVNYEQKFALDINKAFDLTVQWLNGQHKAKLKKITRPSFIEAKQGTMMANTGHDPNWKKRIRINLYNVDNNYILVRIEATPLSRNIIRLEKLKQSWFHGLFSHLFSLLGAVKSSNQSSEPIVETNLRKCSNCGEKIDIEAIICPLCGIDIKRLN